MNVGEKGVFELSLFPASISLWVGVIGNDLMSRYFFWLFFVFIFIFPLLLCGSNQGI